MVSHRVKRAIPCAVGAPQQAIRRFDVPLHKRQVGVQHLSISGGTCSSRWLLDLYVITHVQRVAILDLPRGDVSCTMTRATTAGEGSITCLHKQVSNWMAQCAYAESIARPRH